MRAERDELRTALEELRQASTPSQRRHAQREVAAAETGLAKALRDAGYHDISEGDLEDLRRSRRRAEFDQWLAEAEAARAGAGDDDKGDGKGKGKTGTGTRTKPPADDDDKGDGDRGRGRRGYFE